MSEKISLDSSDLIYKIREIAKERPDAMTITSSRLYVIDSMKSKHIFRT